MPAEEQPRQRLRALRAITDLLSDPHGNHVVGILPEGPVGESRLVAMKGAGAFLYYLYQRGIPILPVGLGEWDGVLVAAFGEPIRLHLPPGLDKEEQDTEAGRQVMAAIARLLPLEASRRDS
jgi:hypothetical protein